METSVPHRHDISDEIWGKLEPHLPGRKGSRGGIAGDKRMHSVDIDYRSSLERLASRLWRLEEYT
jgi:transposase